MAEHESDSIPGLIRSVVDDARELIREEIALAKAELREEASAVLSAGVAFTGAALLGMLGLTLLCIALGGGIADLFELPAWTGYGIVAVLFAGGAYVLANQGRTRLANIRMLPKTKESIRENMAWIQDKSSSR